MIQFNSLTNSVEALSNKLTLESNAINSLENHRLTSNQAQEKRKSKFVNDYQNENINISQSMKKPTNSNFLALHKIHSEPAYNDNYENERVHTLNNNGASDTKNKYMKQNQYYLNTAGNEDTKQAILKELTNSDIVLKKSKIK